jgi:hypothetical protein
MLPGYAKPFRHDRSDQRKGGGVCCYVRSGILCFLLETSEKCPSFIENIWLEFPSIKSIIATFYVPPNLTAHQNELVVDYVVNLADKFLIERSMDHLILVGDFNQLPTDAFERLLGVAQTVTEPTRGKSILDKIFVSSELLNYFSSPIIGPNFGKADHKSVMIMPTSKSTSNITFVKFFDFRKSNLERFLTKLATLPWHKMYIASHSVQEKCDMFYDWFYMCMKEIPQYYVEMKSNDKPWITPILKRLINLKHESYRNKSFGLYKHYKEKVRSEIIAAKSNWVKRQQESPKRVWNIVKGISGRKQCDLTSLTAQFASTQEAAEAINSTFTEYFSATTPNWENIESNIGKNDSWMVDTSVQTIYNELKKLNPKKACGSDGIPIRLLKEAALFLAEPLAHLLSCSISEGSIPTQWKTTNIIPIPKSSNIIVANLRPISLLPTISKILEKRVLAAMKPSLLDLYGSNQFGFRPRSSTLCALISLLDFTTFHLDKKETAGVAIISFDMSKAFDKLSHAHLFDTLLRSSLPHKCLRWCANYLKDRKQRIILPTGITSSLAEVTSGVPQGAILSPYLFASHMGSLKPASAETAMVKFADDVAVAIPYTSTPDIEHQSADEMENMNEWCKQNGLVLNEKKTRLMLIDKRKDSRNLSIPGVSLTTDMKILGVTLQANLKWDAHINLISKSASRRIFLLKAMKKLSASKSDILQVYKAHIQSILEYNSPLFVGATKRNHLVLDKIRKRCHRIICDFECRCNLLPSLTTRRKEKALKFFESMLQKDHILHDICPTILPHSNHVNIPFSKTERRAKSFIPHCSLLYNCALRNS